MRWDRRSAEELVTWMPEASREQLEQPRSGLAADMRDCLRVPIVDPLVLLLANYPAYLDEAWAETRPNLSTFFAERLGDQIRRIALLDPPFGTPFGEHRCKLEEIGYSGERICHIEDLTDTVAYLVPKLLMFALALRESLSVGALGGANLAEEDLSPLPRGVAPGAIDAPLMNPFQMADEVANQLETVVAVHRHPRLTGYFRLLANWPEYLRLLWTDLEPIVRTPGYDAKAEMVLDLARKGVRRFPYAMQLDRAAVARLGLSEESIDEIAQVLEVFAFRLLPDTIVDVAVAKGLLEGRAGARESRLSLG